MTILSSGPSISENYNDKHNIGDVTFYNQMLNVWDGQSFVPVHQEAYGISDLEVDKIKRITDNYEKYEEILRHHFPEDFL